MKSQKEKTSIKAARKLDKKSSRGVVFENEGLRLRTIEINAEVERSQSDLRKLKKENETLKHQVWTLRDEYDKLETKVKGGDITDDEIDENEENDLKDSDLEEASCSSVHQAVADGISNPEEDVPDNIRVNDPQKEYCGQMSSIEYSLTENDVKSTNPVHTFCGERLKHSPSIHFHSHGESEHPVMLPSDISVHGGCDSVQSGNPYLQQSDHFNLDQLLDFASSFHYDRRKHLSIDESEHLLSHHNVNRKSSFKTEIAPSNEENKTSSPPSSSLSSIRRKSSTIIENIKSGSSSAFVKEIEMSLHDNNSSCVPSSHNPQVSNDTTTVSYSHSSYYISGPLDGRSQSVGAGLNTADSSNHTTAPDGPLYSSNSTSNIASGTTSTSLDSNLPLVSVYSSRASMVRLSSIEPNTIMISVSDIPQLWDICTQEIIDEIETQASSFLLDINGVRVASRAAYISVGHKESVQSLMESGLTIRGFIVPMIDITRESVILTLSGVPHYIADCTLSILLSAFGTIIGEIERRFYKGVDTGERYVRIKLKKNTNLPKYVTVGGCRIILNVHGREKPLSLIKELGAPESMLPPPNPHSILKNLEANEYPFPSTSKDERIDSKKKDSKSGKSMNRGSSLKNSKTYSSHCLVNLKLPESSDPLISTPLLGKREKCAPIATPSTSGCASNTSMNHNNLLRVGSLGRSSKPRGENHVNESSLKIKSPSLSQTSTTPLLDDLPREASNSRSNSVAFKDSNGRKGVFPPAPPLPQVPSNSSGSHLSNGILRKVNTEQETLLPNQSQGPTATIRNRLKIGRSTSYDSAKQKQMEKEKKKLASRKMESISESTLVDEASDITPLEASRSNSSRRDSVKSSSSSENKQRREVIDLPWCGCWGNGCF